MTLLNVVNNITELLDSTKISASILPPLLLKSASLSRPGLSAYRITTQIIQDNKALNIPTGENPDGSVNMINQYTYNVVKAIVDALKYEATVQIAIPQNSLLIKSEGANGGGPVVCIGTNLVDSIGNGILQ